MKPIDAAKDAIRALHDHITALGVATQEAAVLLRNAIATAIEDITGKAKRRPGRPARSAAAAPAAKKATKAKKAAKAPKARKGGKRGAKPGGRQLKAALGVKAYEALSDDVRAKGRAVITALRDDWKSMPKKDQMAALAQAGIHASSAGGAKPGKARKTRKAKAAAPAAPKAEASAS